MTETEKHILFTVLAMFSEGKRVTIKGIAKEANISRQLIYHHINKQKNKSFKELIKD